MINLFVSDIEDFTMGVENLVFTEEGQLCASVNITTDDDTLESNELIRAIISTRDSAVNLTPSMAFIKINDSDGIYN